MCTAAPAKYGRSYAVLATLAEFVAIALWLDPPLVNVFGREVPAVFLANLASLVSYMLFLQFLVKCCEGMKQPGLAGAAGLAMERTVRLIVVPLALYSLPVGLAFIFYPLAIVGYIGVTRITIVLTVQWLLDYLQLLSFLKNHLLA